MFLRFCSRTSCKSTLLLLLLLLLLHENNSISTMHIIPQITQLINRDKGSSFFPCFLSDGRFFTRQSGFRRTRWIWCLVWPRLKSITETLWRSLRRTHSTVFWTRCLGKEVEGIGGGALGRWKEKAVLYAFCMDFLAKAGYVDVKFFFFFFFFP